jgi:L-ascorbate metabolism protein UlaG (beta-lactamase superfamily)/rhodanese-related sulfurtransferase
VGVVVFIYSVIKCSQKTQLISSFCVSLLLQTINNMKKLITNLLALLGLATACSQQGYENVDVNVFASQITDPDVVLLDVRTAEEYMAGHIANAINIDVKQDGFVDKAKSTLPADKTIAVYCKGGKRSANAADMLAKEGYKVVNLAGGITAWKNAGMQVGMAEDACEVDSFTTKTGKTVKFHALVHASIRIEYDGREIQIDPVSKLGEKVIDYAAMPPADYIFITHEHHDHFDTTAIRQLTGDNTQIITNQRCAEMLGYGTVMANGDFLQLADDFTVEAVPAYNITDEHLRFHPEGRDDGFILTLDGLRIYIAGDTEDIAEMAEIKDIDIAFMPCNQPYTMTPEQLVNAARVVKPKVLFPYHYGQTDVSCIPSQLESDGVEVRIRHYE